VLIVAVVHFVIDSVRKILDIPSYILRKFERNLFLLQGPVFMIFMISTM